MKHIMISAIGLSALFVSLFSCSDLDTARVEAKAAADFASLRDAWNARDFEAFFALADETRFLSDRDTLQSQLMALRERTGEVVHHAGELVHGGLPDPRGYAAAHQVQATEHGVMRMSLVYDRSLRVVGFEIQDGGSPLQAR